MHFFSSEREITMTDSTDNTENSAYKEEPRHIVCPYCGGQLFVAKEYSGGYGGWDEVTGFECLESGCAAEWDAKGKLTLEPGYQRHPDIYQKPNVSEGT